MNTPPELRQFTKNFGALENLRKNWGWFLLLGLIFVGLGSVAIGTATLTTFLSVVLLGSMLLFSGAVQIIYSFFLREWSGFFLSLLAGILYGIVGLSFIIHPEASALTLTILIAAFYIVGGLFRIIASATSRFNQWGWALFSGVIKLALGIMIWAGWPETGFWIIGLFVGIDLLFFGWFWIILALTARNVKKAIR